MSSMSEKGLRRLREALREMVPELRGGWFVTLDFNCPATSGSARTALRHFADRLDGELLGAEYFGSREERVFFVAAPERRRSSFCYHLLVQFNDETGMARLDRCAVLRRAWTAAVPSGSVDVGRALWPKCRHASNGLRKGIPYDKVIISTSLRGVSFRRGRARGGWSSGGR